jgi:hypothetical protein
MVLPLSFVSRFKPRQSAIEASVVVQTLFICFLSFRATDKNFNIKEAQSEPTCRSPRHDPGLSFLICFNMSVN